jgi:alpha-L-rhamnosidase
MNRHTKIEGTIASGPGSAGVPPAGFGVPAETNFHGRGVSKKIARNKKSAKAGTPSPTGGTPVLPGFSPSSRALFLIALALIFTRVVIAETPQQKRGVITDHGAKGDGQTLNTKAIQSAIDECAKDGGGVIVVPRGVFITGSIFLKPGVNLLVEKDGVLKGSGDTKDYPKMKTRIEGHFEEWLPALVNADKCDHLRISGPGTLDGNGAPFWKAFGDQRKVDPKAKNLDVPRPRLALIQNSDDVQISGVVFKDSSLWNLHLYRCKNVVVEKSRFEVPPGAKCPSTDGTDIDSCQNVTVRDCVYSVDDDCVCLKGSKGPFALQDKDSLPVEHIVVTGCTFERGHGVVTLGSEATVIRDVVVENCRVTGKIPLVRIKVRPDTPQHYEDIHYRNITLAGGGAIIECRPWAQYFDLRGQPPPQSVVKNVTVSDIKGSFGSFGEIVGNAETTISDITLENIDVTLKDAHLKLSGVKNITTKNVKVNGEAMPTPQVQ